VRRLEREVIQRCSEVSETGGDIGQGA
jgi:hypothetical protein